MEADAGKEERAVDGASVRNVKQDGAYVGAHGGALDVGGAADAGGILNMDQTFQVLQDTLHLMEEIGKQPTHQHTPEMTHAEPEIV